MNTKTCHQMPDELHTLLLFFIIIFIHLHMETWKSLTVKKPVLLCLRAFPEFNHGMSVPKVYESNKIKQI